MKIHGGCRYVAVVVVVVVVVAACAPLRVCAHPPASDRANEMYISISRSSGAESPTTGDYGFGEVSAGKLSGLVEDGGSGQSEEEEEEEGPSTMRAITRRTKSNAALLPLIIEPEAEMLPAGYKGVKPPGVSHMELVLVKPQRIGGWPDRESATTRNDDEDPDKPGGLDRDGDAHYYAASGHETQIARNDGGPVAFQVGLTGDSWHESKKKSVEYVESSSGTRESIRSENEDRAKKERRDEVPARKSAVAAGASGGSREKRKKVRNTAGYRDIYHVDGSSKRDGDFYGRFKRHGRYGGGGRHATAVAAEGTYARGKNNDSKLDEDRTSSRDDRPVCRTRLALPDDYDRVMSFMCDAYFKHEPVIVNIGLSEEEPAPSLLKLMCDQIREGMTIIAEGEDDCIAGVAVNAGSCPWDPDKYVELARRHGCGPVRDVIEFWAYVTRKPNLWQRYCVLKIFECSCLAVGPDFRNGGIARKLVLDSWYLARDCGYRLFRIDCSNRYTAQIACGFGWQHVCTIPFEEYTKNGEVIFKHIEEPHTEVQVYVDRVFCKDYCPPYKECKKPTGSAPS